MELTPDELRSMLIELLDLEQDADDAAIKSAFDEQTAEAGGENESEEPAPEAETETEPAAEPAKPKAKSKAMRVLGY